MRWLVASDIHGSATACRRVLDAFVREKADGLLLLGDLLYHGPRNPLPEGHDPKQCVQMLNEYRDYIAAVRGNCEAAVDQMVLQFPVMADYMLLQLGGRRIFATHGDVYNPEHLPPLAKGGILLTGHTHVPACDIYSDFVYLNPGSVSLPKDEQKHKGYILLDDTGAVFKELDGTEYHRYMF